MDPSQSSGQAPDPNQQNIPVQPVSPALTTAIHKEAEPFSTEELMQPSERELTLHEEVEKAGVETRKEIPDLTLEDKKAGIALAKESIPASSQPLGMVKIMTEEEAEKIAKEKKAGNSIVWLATSLWRQFKMMHQKIIADNTSQ